MHFPIITNDNFKKTYYFEGLNNLYNPNQYSYHREDNTIVFETNFICCPCIYWIKKGDLWAFSFAVETIEEWCAEHNIELEERTNFDEFGEVGKHFKLSVQRHYKYKGINYIEGWKKVFLYSDGTFKKEDYQLPVFSLEIKYNYDLYKKWILKYKKIIEKINQDANFTPTMTGGLDTRIFSCLYRDLKILTDRWYIREVKNDGKNKIEKGKKEVEIAREVINRIGFSKYVMIVDKPGITLSGMFIENTRFFKEPNNLDWIYKYVQHCYGNDRKYYNLIMPYADDMWLMFKQEHLLQRCLGALLFCPDLLDIKLIGTSDQYEKNPEGYNFYEEYKDVIPKAKEIMDYWGKEKCKTILNEN